MQELSISIIEPPNPRDSLFDHSPHQDMATYKPPGMGFGIDMTLNRSFPVKIGVAPEPEGRTSPRWHRPSVVLVRCGREGSKPRTLLESEARELKRRSRVSPSPKETVHRRLFVFGDPSKVPGSDLGIGEKRAGCETQFPAAHFSHRAKLEDAAAGQRDQTRSSFRVRAGYQALDPFAAVDFLAYYKEDASATVNMTKEHYPPGGAAYVSSGEMGVLG
ncbi:hypothetical protein NMY22_g9151 [Coprinellus aureogranulatus]|nr:hypothetical protein NMY22_g9151 [Coprinellus aureogranulatus]